MYPADDFNDFDEGLQGTQELQAHIIGNGTGKVPNDSHVETSIEDMMLLKHYADGQLDSNKSSDQYVLMLPRPTSGRFYSSKEFHIVGHLVPIRFSKPDPSLPHMELTLLGKEVMGNLKSKEQWQYVALYKGNYMTVIARTGQVMRNCTASRMCDRNLTRAAVILPDLTGPNVYWQAILYKHL
jgi:hypothetical protein